MTDADAGAVLASELYLSERGVSNVVPAVYRPLRMPGMHDPLGVVAQWHAAAQDIDFERRLLLRALLTALPPGVCKLPPSCLTLDDLDLAPIKVQALLEALTARRRIDLGDAEFRWDLGRHDGSLTTGGGPWDAVEDGSPPFSGMSKRQLELASFEALLQASLSPPFALERASQRPQPRLAPPSACPVCPQALGAGRALDMMEGEDKEKTALIKAVATRLGITGRQHRRMLQALRRAEEPGESAARRCSLTYRLRALQENLPADFGKRPRAATACCALPLRSHCTARTPDHTAVPSRYGPRVLRVARAAGRPGGLRAPRHAPRVQL